MSSPPATPAATSAHVHENIPRRDGTLHGYGTSPLGLLSTVTAGFDPVFAKLTVSQRRDVLDEYSLECSESTRRHCRAVSSSVRSTGCPRAVYAILDALISLIPYLPPNTEELLGKHQARRRAAEAAARERARIALSEAAAREQARIAAAEAARVEQERAAAEEAARLEQERAAAEETARQYQAHTAAVAARPLHLVKPRVPLISGLRPLHPSRAAASAMATSSENSDASTGSHSSTPGSSHIASSPEPGIPTATLQTPVSGPPRLLHPRRVTPIGLPVAIPAIGHGRPPVPMFRVPMSDGTWAIMKYV